MKARDITLRLAASFCLLAAVLLVVGWQGVSRLRQLNAQMQNIVGNQWKEVQLSHEAFHLSELNSRITLTVFFLDDPREIKQLLAERAANTNRISDLMSNLEPRLDPDESRLFATVKATRTPYVESYQQALSLLLTENKRDAARKMMVDVVRPKLIAYHDAWSAFDQHETAEIDQFIQETNADYVTGQREFLFTLVLAGAIASVIAIFTVIRMGREIAFRQRAEQSLHQAYDQLEQRVRDRTADLEKANEALKAEISERKLAEIRLERLRDEHKAVLNSVGVGVHCIDLDGQIIYENPAAAKMLGYEISDLIGKPAHQTIHHTRADGAAYPVGKCHIYATLRDGGKRHISEEVFWRKDGTSLPIEYTSTPVRDENGHIVGAVVVFTDLTERQRIEARLLQSQKMKMVGRLAGGVAHEFNSILTAIIGQSELLLSEFSPDNPLGKNVREIRHAADRAATLTRQLLAYGRKQILQPEVLDLNRILTEMASTLQFLMGKEVDVRIVTAVGLKTVKIDPGQIQQVIVNLVMNAADAMPNGGQLTLETANITLDEDYVRPFPGLKPGDYVMLAITDTGVGMGEEVKARAFEPFFSTKAVGQGTGLGLATCYGILKQSDGHINVYSEPARGTTFKIYLPQIDQLEKTPLSRANPPEMPRGTETILLAEDDPSLLEMAATLLKRLGYTVHTAANGIEAMGMRHQKGIGHIDLLFTDVVMPHMTGKELSDRIRTCYPRIKILFTSAYTESAIVHQGILNEGVTLLQKPFTPSALAHKVREVLDQ